MDREWRQGQLIRCEVLASGAKTNNELGSETDNSVQILSTDDAAKGLFDGVMFEIEGTKSLMIDRSGNYETALVMESLAKRGSSVTLAIPSMTFGSNIGFTHLDDFLRSMPGLGIRLLPTTILDEVSQGRAHLENDMNGEEIQEIFDFIVAGVSPGG